MEDLVKLMQEMSNVVKRILAQQERFSADLEQFRSDQGKAATALGEAGVILLNHAKALNSYGSALTVLCKKAGLPLRDAPPKIPPAVN